MSGTTKIEWSEYVWNPVSGCHKVSKGCRNCYAERLWPRLAAPGQPYEGRQFTDVQCHVDRLEEPLSWRKPRRVFVNSMSDLFHKHVSDEFLDRVFAVMSSCPQHTFQILTKRPKRMQDYIISRKHFSNWPLLSVWLGVSVENQETADERIPLLLKTPAALRFVSAEPLLGPIDLTNFLDGRLGWVIVGTESGPEARPYRFDWILDILKQCRDAETPVFIKQITDLGRKIPYEILPPVMQVRHWPNVNGQMEMVG